ncbi:MAG: type II toxin-antitoxin system VapC family toxin [Acidobacteria bacterium]|nr:type II toxin-antitoxin system VapC family toxin [Acidobacteriota bacterium]
MKFLLDTHTFIWWTLNPTRLSAKAHSLLQDPQHEPFLSLISIWEMQIKQQIGKLHFNQPLDFVVAEQQRINRLRLMPLQADHIYGLGKLPFHHKDPFDRLLISQAISETFPLMSADPMFSAYPAQLIW